MGEYDKIFDEIEQERAQSRARATAIAAPAISPDDMGRALSIAQRREQPPLVVADNLADFDEREHLDAVQDAARNPVLGAWLQQPEHAALVKDDLPATTKLAHAVSLALPLLQASPAFAGLLAGPAIQRGVQRAGVGHAANIGNLSAVASTGQAAGELLDMPSAALRPLFGEGFDPLGTRRFAREAAGVAGEAGKELQATAVARPTLDQAQANPLDALSQAVAHYVQQAAQSAPSTLAALATRNPTLGAAVMGAPSGAQAYSQLREQGVSRSDAVVAGVGSGAIEIVGERLGLEALLAPWRKALLTGPATEFGEEFVTQIAQQNVQDQATGERTPVAQQLSDAFDAGVTGFTMGSAVVGARALSTFGRVAKSADEASKLSDITEAAASSRLGKRAPAALERLVGDTGTVYVPVEAVRTLFQGDVAAFAREVTGDPDALTAAGEFGDLAIPLAKWASLVAQQPNAEEWAKHGRLDADGYSRADLESVDFDAELAKLHGDTEAAAERATPQQQEAVDRIRDDVMGALIASDRYSPADAELQAKLIAKMFGTLGRRSGADPFALYQQYNLRINGRGGNPGKPNTLDPRNEALLDAVLTDRIPGERDVFGPSLVEALVAMGGVQDPGGDLRSRDADKQFPGTRAMFGREAKPGLINPMGMPLDAAREWAVEAGYLRDEGREQDGVTTSGINDLLDAIDAELRGAPVFSQQNRDAQRDAFRNDALDLQQAIDEKFRDMPREEFAKLSRAEIYDRLFTEAGFFQRMAGKVRELYQAAFPQRDESQPKAKDGPAGADLRARWMADFDAVWTEYAALSGEFDSDGGRILNTDLARELSPEYRADRSLSADVHEAASDFIKEAYRRKLAAPTPDGLNPDVVLSAGGTGAGKTTGLRQAGGVVGQAEIIYDTNANRVESAVDKIEAALAAGRNVAIVYTYRDPVESLRRGALPRASRMEREHGSGRTVPLSEHARTHIGSAETIRALVARYGDHPNVAFSLIDNSRGKGQEALVDLENLPGVEQDGLDERLLASLDEAHSAGEISERTRRGFAAGSRRVQGAGQENGRGNPRQPQAADGRQVNQNPAAGGVSASGGQTDTPAFRKWFGDSKVVDAQGKPLVVYHGAPDARFMGADATFMSIGDRYGEQRGVGAFWFARDQSTARSYADDRRAFDFQNAEPATIAAYLKLENPLVVDGGGKEWREAQSIGKTTDVIEKAQAEGHDGVIIRNVRDHYNNGPRTKPTDTYVVFDSRQIKSATANNGNFDPADPSILRQGEANPRGQLRIGADRSMSIDLFATADLSTFLHESGHFFLEVMGDLAARPDAPQQVRDDYAAILSWLGNTGEPLTVDQHEAWAEAFEQYLMEGKAPAPELQSGFSRFRAWLSSIYKAMLQLRVPLTDEVRSVMDRMIATDEEIEAAQQRQGMEPLPLGEEARALLTPGQWEAYVASTQAATEEARQDVFAKLAASHRRAAEAWYREETARVRAQVEAEFEAAPAVRAWRILAGREQVDGAPVPPELRVRLDRDAIAALYDAPTGQRMLERLRPLGVYRKAGGVSPDVAASLLGFDSGDALLQALAGVRDLSARVDAETTARMRERHPDPLTDGSLPERAMGAVHGNRRVAALEAELALLATLANKPRPNRRALVALAERTIAAKRVRDIRPNDYLVAERKAANEATRAAAKGDYAAALKAKRDQAQQSALYSQARKAQETADKAGSYLKRFTTAKVRAGLGKAGADYLEQIDGLLERFDFRQVSGAESSRRARLADWIERQRADGRDLDLPAKLLDDAFRQPWRDLTVAELTGLRDAVKQIAHLADLKNVLLLGNEQRDRQAVDEAMAASVRAGNAERPARTGDETLGDAVRRDVLQARAATGAATDIARELDGFADGGSVWDNTVRIIRDAITQQVNPALQQAQEALSTLYRQHYTMAELRGLQQRRAVPGVPDAWSKGRILALALNWGNAGNREAILTQARGRLSPEQIGILLGTLDKRDWDFVQGVWQQIDAYWPDIAAAERRRKGLVPEKVEPAPFAITTSDGHALQIPGGYYPLKYEIDTAKAMREEADSFYDAIRTGRFAKAATKDGHTIERVGSGGRSVRLDLGVVETHLRDVIRDLHLGDAVNYVHQALHGSAFNAAVADTGNVELVRALETWLRDVASGEIGLRTRAEKTLRAVRGNFTAAVLTWKFVSAALQITGIIQTSVVLGKQHTLDGITRYTRRPRATGRYVNEASPYMAQRVFSHVEAVQQVMDAKAGRFASGRSAMIRWGYWMMGRVQRMVDVATWLGAEARGMELFDGDVKKARAFADDMVARAQGSGEFVDKNPLQRGTIGDSVRQSEYIRATTALMGYMIAKSNAAYGRTKTTNFRSFREGVKWAGDMANLFVVEALVVAIIRGQLPDDDDDDGSTVDDWLALAAKEGASNLFGGIPGLSQAVSELRGYDAKGIVSSAWESAGRAIAQAKQGELDKAAVKSAVTLAGFATGLPSSQINKTIDAIAAKQDGQDVNAYDYLAGPPKD